MCVRVRVCVLSVECMCVCVGTCVCVFACVEFVCLRVCVCTFLLACVLVCGGGWVACALRPFPVASDQVPTNEHERAHCQRHEMKSRYNSQIVTWLGKSSGESPPAWQAARCRASTPRLPAQTAAPAAPPHSWSHGPSQPPAPP